ncbi:MAG TPA: sialidase family protein [Streptosporangiaceae bacterium]|nr:sialidase family protein [Streptosporangiaceae bacterium]
MKNWLATAGLTAAVTAALGLAPVTAASANVTSLTTTRVTHTPLVGVGIGPITDFSKSSSCSGQNSEVEQAADPAGKYVYEEWMSCNGGLGFATSSNRGQTFGTPVTLPSSGAGWDPSVAVAPNGTVYAAFMTSGGNNQSFPVVEASTDHGATWPQVTQVIPKKTGNWGDRDFIAVAPNGNVYLTWDYGPSAAKVTFICSPTGSCSFATGDLNEVFQKSINGGKTFGAMVHVSPGFPASGADSGPMVVEPNGQIDMEYQGYKVVNLTTDKLGTANSYYTSSTDGGTTWSTPVRLGPATVTMSTAEWWIDGAIAMDAGGDLYATWDTQSGHQDIGWLAFSTNHGKTWSPTVQVTTDVDNATHIMEPAGGPAGFAYAGWLADNATGGYAEYLRVFSVTQGWLTAPIQVSQSFGNKKTWPGDTFGINTLPGGTAGTQQVALSWGSAVAPSTNSEDYSSVVTISGLKH